MNEMIAVNTINQKLPQKAYILASDIAMEDGSKSQIITIFNNDKTSFEDIEAGVRKGLQLIRKVKSISSELFFVRNGNISQCGIKYPEHKIKHIYED